MFERIPIRYRLALGLCVGMTFIFVSLGIVVYKIVEQKLYDSVDAALLVSAKSIRDARFGNEISQPVMQQFLESLMNPDRVIRPYAQLVDFSGRVSVKSDNILINLPISPKALSRAEQGLLTYETFDGGENVLIRQLSLPIYRFGRFSNELVQVATSLSHIRHSLREVIVLLWTALPFTLLFSILFAYYITRRSLQPVTRITAAASKLGIQNLKTRLPVSRAKDEIRDLAEQFNLMMERLDESFGRLHRFAGDVSHELRTPLTVMRTESELALRKERDKEEYKTALKVISKESKGMSETVENLLLLARAESRTMALSYSLCDVAKMIEGIFLSLKMEADAKKITMTLKNNLAKACFEISEKYLEIIVSNLVRNAIKHSEEGSVVEVVLNSDSKEWRIEVVDFGTGIPEESLSKIFDPFFRVDSARNRKLGGVGLGLSLAKALTELMNGRIMVESQLNYGSSFKVSFPIVTDQML